MKAIRTKVTREQRDALLIDTMDLLTRDNARHSIRTVWGLPDGSRVEDICTDGECVHFVYTPFEDDNE